jgi:cytochrome oxidase Cu insertion factor (SCO1/SenC/PrrC family)
MMQTRNKKRLQLVLIASLFAMPLLFAAILAATGWVPGTRSFGEGIVPQRSVMDVQVDLADGSHLVWRDPEWRWTLVAIPGRNCGTVCIKRLDLMHRARISLNQNSRRVRLLYLGTPPTGTDVDQLMSVWQVGTDVNQGFADWRPDVDDGVAAVLVKPDGVALTFYADGFDPSGLRKDLAKVTK